MLVLAFLGFTHILCMYNPQHVTPHPIPPLTLLPLPGLQRYVVLSKDVLPLHASCRDHVHQRLLIDSNHIGSQSCSHLHRSGWGWACVVGTLFCARTWAVVLQSDTLWSTGGWYFLWDEAEDEDESLRISCLTFLAWERECLD